MVPPTSPKPNLSFHSNTESLAWGGKPLSVLFAKSGSLTFTFLAICSNLTVVIRLSHELKLLEYELPDFSEFDHVTMIINWCEVLKCNEQ